MSADVAGSLPQCELLPWDSDFFSKKIARVTQANPDPATFAAIHEWARRNSVDCLYFLAPGDEIGSMYAAEKGGFQMVDIRVTFELKIASRTEAPVSGVRFATAADIPALRAIAAASHHDSRFYADPHFPRDRCDKLYEIWIEKAVLNSRDAVIVIDEENLVKGYCACHLRQTGTGNIGLVAVAPEAQGRGSGRAMLDGALRWFAEKKCQEITVVTQARNIRAMRFYQKAGFLTRSVEIWFHRWFTAN